MRNIFLATTSNYSGVFKYGKVLFLFLLMSACVASSLPAGQVGQASSPDSMKASGDACPTKEELIKKTRTLQMPFIANNGQVDEQVKFYAKTFGGTVFVTKDGDIVYSLPEGRGRDVPAGASQQDTGDQGSRGAEGQGRKLGKQDAVRQMQPGWHGQALLVRAASELVAANVYSPLLRADNANCPPERVLAKALLAAYLPGLPNSAIQNPQSPIRGVALKETLLGANICGIAGEQPAVTTVNYFTGNDKSKWKTNVPTYNRVNLGEVYKGVELSLKAYGDNVEKLFCVKPGASPESIKVQLDGSKSLRVNHDGQLEADTDLGLVKFTRPIAYQEIEGKRVEVECKYAIAECVKNLEFRFWNVDYFPYSAFRISKATNSGSKNPQSKIENPKFEYGFTVASYDKTKDLIIDPLLSSTFLGGAGFDYGYALTLDTSGHVYVAGYAWSGNFPTTSGAYDTSFNGSYDVFVSKLDGGLTSLLASTFLGGSGEDYGYALTLDPSGNVYVTGETWSIDFPTTSGAYDTSFNGRREVFVSKLDSGLTSLLASTFLGGSSDDYGRSLTLDTSGNVYVTGETGSRDFPVYGAYSTYQGGVDVFISKLNSGLTGLLVSTFLGGSSDDYGRSLTLDASGNVYVTGYTNSTDFPIIGTAYDLYFNGGYADVFVSKLNSELGDLLASTFLGGSSGDYGYSLALDPSGNVYVTGWTTSTNFPTTSGAYDTSYNGSDVFVSKLDGGLTSLLASTYLGGSVDDSGYSLTLDPSGNVYVTGWTGSTNFPTTSGAYDTSHNGGGDVFVSKLDGNLSATVECQAESITASPERLTLRKGKNGNVTITVKGAGDCLVEGVTVTATIKGKDKQIIGVSPGSQETDANGQAVFTINAKDTKGTAVIKFKASGLSKVATVRVKVR